MSDTIGLAANQVDNTRALRVYPHLFLNTKIESDKYVTLSTVAESEVEWGNDTWFERIPVPKYNLVDAIGETPAVAPLYTGALEGKFTIDPRTGLILLDCGAVSAVDAEYDDQIPQISTTLRHSGDPRLWNFLLYSGVYPDTYARDSGDNTMPIIVPAMAICKLVLPQGIEICWVFSWYRLAITPIAINFGGIEPDKWKFQAIALPGADPENPGQFMSIHNRQRDWFSDVYGNKISRDDIRVGLALNTIYG